MKWHVHWAAWLAPTATLPPHAQTRRRRRRWYLAGSTAVLVLLVVFLPGSLGPALAPRPLPPGTYLDLHTHVAGIGAGDSGCFVAPGLRQGFKFGIYLRAFGVTEEEMAKHGDGLVAQRLAERVAASERVGGAVVLALDAALTPAGEPDWERTELYVPNAFIKRETDKYPNLFYGASINPLRPDALERLAQAKADGAVLIKWLPPIMHFDPADPRLVPFYQALVAHRLPLLTHTGDEHAFTRAEHHYGDPDRLRLPLSLGVTVIAAHAATPGKSQGESNLDRLLAMMTEYPNLYADISSLTQLNKLVFLGRLLPRDEARGRLLYGSDYPLVNTALISPWYYTLNLGWRDLRRLSKISNPFDRDVALKQALGMPPEVFTASAELLGVTLPAKPPVAP